MKTLTMRWMIAVAALAVAAGTASAQTYRAQIPMSFRAANALMVPGTYEIVVNTNSGHGIVSVRNLDTSSSVLVVPLPGSDAPKAWRQAGKPMVSFDCLGSECSLRQLWNGHDITAYEFRSKALPTVEAQRMSVVTLALIKTR
jgi:hypothetical protein